MTLDDKRNESREAATVESANDLSRRDFVAVSLAAGWALAAGSASAAPSETHQYNQDHRDAASGAEENNSEALKEDGFREI
jgi:hypothetical protein